MSIRTRIAIAVIALGLWSMVGGAVARADKAAGSPAPAASASGGGARDGGMIDGQIASVDYQRGFITVQSPARGKIDVQVLPSTNIQGRGNSYHGISDLNRGDHVHVFTSQSGNHYTAQIIQIL